MKGNLFSSRMFVSLFVVLLGLSYCSTESNHSVLGQPQLFGPSEALVGQAVDFYCSLQIYPKDETILLQLYKEGDRNKVLGMHTLAENNGTIPMLIKRSHGGNLECVARAQNNSNIEPTVSRTHYLKVVEPVKGAQIDVPSGQMELFEEEELALFCKVSAGNHVTYKWLLNGRLVSESSFNDHLVISSGSYMCVATNQFNGTVFSSNSSEVVVTVKDIVSDPDISFTVLKEDSHSYSAVVTCQSTKGTPPVTFLLYNQTELVANTTVNERNAIFKVPLVLGQHQGRLQCQADNGNEIKYSQWIPVEVVPVGGPVMMLFDYDVGENYAVVSVKFHCMVAKGSHPQYQWFLNKTLLPDRGSFYSVVTQPFGHSFLLLSVGRSSAGTYHCEVSDSFDNTTAISSKGRYIDKEVLNRLPILVVAVVFGCFTFLVLLVSICCCIGVVYRRRRYGEKSLASLEMERMVAVNEDELDLSECNEDADVVMLARGAEFDQASEASEDEWPQIEEEKKTLEDEAVEEP